VAYTLLDEVKIIDLYDREGHWQSVRVGYSSDSWAFC